jgi:tetratricopeptide (TPR) repeat protein
MFRLHRANSSSSAGLSAVGALVLAAIVLAPAAAQRKPAPSPAPDAATAYDRCMSLADTQPAEAQKLAMQWRTKGGGYAAEHCEAAALLNLKQYDEAAKRFHDVAEGTAAEDASLRAEAYDQAAEAWLMAQKPQNARAELDAGLKLAPRDVRLLMDRGQAEGLAHDFWAALDDLNAALDIEPNRAEALVLRAAAYRQVDAADLAADDVARAIALQPEFADAYLERGTLRAIKGDYDGARADWNRVKQLAPGSFAADLAQQDLAKLTAFLAKAAKPVNPAKPAKP